MGMKSRGKPVSLARNKMIDGERELVLDVLAYYEITFLRGMATFREYIAKDDSGYARGMYDYYRNALSGVRHIASQIKGGLPNNWREIARKHREEPK